MFIEALQWLIPIDNGNVQVIKLPQLVGGLYSSTRHSTDQRVPSHEFLQGNRIEDAPALRDFQALFGLYSCLQPVGPALQIGDATTGGIDKLQLAVHHDVVNIAYQQCLCVQRQVDFDEDGADIVLGIKGIDAELSLYAGCAYIGKLHRAPVI